MRLSGLSTPTSAGILHHDILFMTDISLHAESRRTDTESALAVLDAQERILPAATATKTFSSYYYAMSCYTMDACIFLSHLLKTSQSARSSTDSCSATEQERIQAAPHRAITLLDRLQERSLPAQCGLRIVSAADDKLSQGEGQRQAHGQGRIGGGGRPVVDRHEQNIRNSTSSNPSPAAQAAPLTSPPTTTNAQSQGDTPTASEYYMDVGTGLLSPPDANTTTLGNRLQ